MQIIEPLLPGRLYHIYNCGINGEDLFREKANYEYFLRLYDLYIEPIAETYAWCLMKNHFHLIVRIKEDEGVERNNIIQTCQEKNLTGGHQCFSNLFNRYAKSFNKMYGRHGSLFERPFKRKMIFNEIYLRTAILYIHNNPVHHSFAENTEDYFWSSYLTCISQGHTKLKREQVIDLFGNVENFKYAHKEKVDIIKIENWLME
ncbi:MAG: hypothetical protein Q8880_07880 [Bacteroidota bacterium]|nr:hypothetical protein [Bacteroidota bacterium]